MLIECLQFLMEPIQDNLEHNVVLVHHQEQDLGQLRHLYLELIFVICTSNVREAYLLLVLKCHLRLW